MKFPCIRKRMTITTQVETYLADKWTVFNINEDITRMSFDEFQSVHFESRDNVSPSRIVVVHLNPKQKKRKENYYFKIYISLAL